MPITRTQAFWRARDAWNTRREATLVARAMEKHQHTVSGSGAVKFEHARNDPRRLYRYADRRWQEMVRAGLVLTSSTKAKRLGVEVSFSRGLQMDLIRILDAVASAMVDEMDRAAADAAFEIWRAWPVASGFSKASLDLAWGLRGEELVVSVVSRAPYTRFIKPRDSSKMTWSRSTQIVKLASLKASQRIAAKAEQEYNGG
jgi:hypothetical protein